MRQYPLVLNVLLQGVLGTKLAGPRPTSQGMTLKQLKHILHYLSIQLGNHRSVRPSSCTLGPWLVLYCLLPLQHENLLRVN